MVWDISATPHQPPFCPPSRGSAPAMEHRKITSSKPSDVFCNCVQACHTESKFSEFTTKFIVQAKTTQTQTTYGRQLKKWYNYCEPRKIDPHNPTLAQLADCLTTLVEANKLHINSIRNFRTALHAGLYGSIGDTLYHPSITNLIKAADKNKGIPKIVELGWSPLPVLDYIATNYLDNTKLTLMELAKKTVVLILLASGCRQQNLGYLSIAPDSMHRTPEYIEFTLTKPVKNFKLMKADILCNGCSSPDTIKMKESVYSLPSANT